MTGTLLQYVNEEMLYTITTSKRRHTNCQSRLILSHRPISTFIDVKLLELGRLNVPIHLIVGSIIPIILRTAFWTSTLCITHFFVTRYKRANV